MQTHSTTSNNQSTPTFNNHSTTPTPIKNNETVIPQPLHIAKTFKTLPKKRPTTPLLDTINSPAHLKPLTTKQLLVLADELREYLLYSIAMSGGHFGANLGVVELTIALHYLLDTPIDQLLWDVGHQAYAHKVLTGRREQLPSIRSKDGLSAFPERSESVYDSFGVGHSSTVISAGLGMSLAIKHLQKPAQKVVCVIGDGAMTAGLAFEAMNDAVQHNADLLVILNDNDMSISPATGGFAKHLAKLWHTGYHIDINDNGQEKIVPRPNMNHKTRAITHDNNSKADSNEITNLFQTIGFSYFGPFDGHDLPELVRVLQRVQKLTKPVLLHVYTTKGKGFLSAENDPVGYHAISKQHRQIENKETESRETGSKEKKKKTVLSYNQVFGQFLCDTAKIDQRLLAITPAMEEGSGMTDFAQQFPERFFDVAIAEQHAVTLAAGMATQGAKPIVAIYSTFLQRGYDQLIHDVALQNLDVTFAIDRAGLVGEDGATHAGVFDYAYLRCLPNVIIACPKDENECYQLLHTCYQYKGVSAVRYPRGLGTGVNIDKPAQRYKIGKAVLECSYLFSNPLDNKQKTTKLATTKLAILAFGSIVENAWQAASKLHQQCNNIQQCDNVQQLNNTQQTNTTHHPIDIYLINMRWVKPLDTQMLDALLEKGVTHIATIEEHAVMAGSGSAVNEYLLNHTDSTNQNVLVQNLGIPDYYIAHASHQQQLTACALDPNGIVSSLKKFINR